ncbi:amidohydrolase family protein [Microbacterium elymi]|uniref:amidohydrolase family protein n=1 Tax=Microbacterium elymi TaxID=2909587 RepID=UPI00338EE82B
MGELAAGDGGVEDVRRPGHADDADPVPQPAVVPAAADPDHREAVLGAADPARPRRHAVRDVAVRGRTGARGRRTGRAPGPPHFGIDTTISVLRDAPNVHFKITEINMERFDAENVRAAHVVRRMVDEFGPDRLVWGSDIGQSMLWSYEEKAAMARSAADFLTEDEANGFLHDNAARVYLGGR